MITSVYTLEYTLQDYTIAKRDIQSMITSVYTLEYTHVEYVCVSKLFYFFDGE